ncbi:MAG: hypothetical protein ACYTEQ_02170 [Planctomycetota bacterium]|jgi:hypothetical protein
MIDRTNLYKGAEIKMPEVGREKYHNAMVKILEATGFRTERLGLCRILAAKDVKEIYIDVAGKNLPYIGSNGQEAFPWETHVEPDRLDKIDDEAQKHGAQGWLAFCYVILSEAFKTEFKTIVRIEDNDFGGKLIKTTDYRKHMRPRSPTSWDVVELPRNKVTQLTCDAEDI